jgi:beta-barrel assembly-enhancing protease
VSSILSNFAKLLTRMMKQPQIQNLRKLFIFTFIFLFSAVLFGQQDFNNFKTLVSEGPIPADFTSRTSEKIANDIHSGRVKMESTAATKNYLEAIHTSIDEMLLSGYVVYGDEVSEYVKTVAENMLKNSPDLANKFRYYTIKSNETNALSTDQGIIFVTTGLISQLSSEAQLAYVLAHEIAHYTEHHVQNGYQERLKNANKRNRIERMSSYAKDLEFAADRLALKLYHDAGYSEDEIIPTFDVLMYSYLPFDDIYFPRNYFNSETVFVPESEFGTKTYTIKTNENYDDDNSSHPNIRKRKDAINEALRSFSDWDSIVNNLGDDRFNYIRNVARFESLRTNIIDGELCEALYSIFLLEKDFPHSVYLKRMKALTWLSMMQLNAENDLTKILPSQSDYEGESANLYYFIKNLKSKEVAAFGLRQTYDLKKANPEDEYFKLVYDRAVKSAAKTETFVLKEFNTKSMKERLAEMKVEEEKPVDTIASSKSKYDKIKTKTDINSSKTVDTSNFAMYVLPDIIQDPLFLRLYSNYKSEIDSIEAEKLAFQKLSKKERKQALREQNSFRNSAGFDLEKVVLVEPTINFSKPGTTIQQKEQMEDKFITSIENASEEVGVEMQTVSKQTLSTGETKEFNERNAYFSFLNQAANYPGIEIFPVDYQRLKDYTADRGTSVLLFTSADYEFSPELNPLIYVYSCVLFPTLPITLFVYTPIKLIQGTTTTYATILFDTNQGRALTVKYNTVHSKPKPNINQNYYLHLLQLLTKSPK